MKIYKSIIIPKLDVKKISINRNIKSIKSDMVIRVSKKSIYSIIDGNIVDTNGSYFA